MFVIISFNVYFHNFYRLVCCSMDVAQFPVRRMISKEDLFLPPQQMWDLSEQHQTGYQSGLVLIANHWDMVHFKDEEDFHQMIPGTSAIGNLTHPSHSMVFRLAVAMVVTGVGMVDMAMGFRAMGRVKVFLHGPREGVRVDQRWFNMDPLSDDVINNSLDLASKFVWRCARELVDPLFLLKPSQPAGVMLELALALVERRGDCMALAELMDEVIECGCEAAITWTPLAEAILGCL